MDRPDIERLYAKIDATTEALAVFKTTVAEGMGEIRAEIATLSATVVTRVNKQDQELGALWDRTTGHGERIGKIEKDYVPQANCDQRGKENADEHRRFGDRIGKAEIGLAKVFAVAAFAATVASLVTRLVK